MKNKDTSALSIMVSRHPQKMQEKILEIARQVMLYSEIRTKEVGEEQAYRELRAEMDAAIKAANEGSQKQNLTCTKGCSFCCYINVDISPTEARVLINYVTPEVKEKLIAQQGYGLKKYDLLPYQKRACAFLKDNKCSIYAERPMACRKHQVVSSKELCNTEQEDQRVVLASMLMPEIIYAVHLKSESDSMANQILKLVQ